MKRYICAYTNIASWWDYMQPDTDYIVLERADGSLIWEGEMWNLPDREYFGYKILDILYDGGGTCILTVEED